MRDPALGAHLIRINDPGAVPVSDAADEMEIAHDDPRHITCRHEWRGGRLGAFRGAGDLLSDLRAAGPLLADIGLGQGWVALFATAPAARSRALSKASLGSIAAAWLVAGVFVGVYNRLLSRSQELESFLVRRAGTKRIGYDVVGKRTCSASGTLTPEYSVGKIPSHEFHLKSSIQETPPANSRCELRAWDRRPRGGKSMKRDSNAARRHGAGRRWTEGALSAQSRR